MQEEPTDPPEMNKREIIKALLKREAELNDKLSELRDEIEDQLDWIRQDCISAEGMILDILGVPEDNTVTTNVCEIASKTGVWPEWGYCRDWAYEVYAEYIRRRRDIDGFIKEIEAGLQISSGGAK